MGMTIDKKIHDVFDYFNGKEIRWRDFQEVGVEEYYYDFYYAEDCLYVIRDRIYEKYYFVEARSPKQALDAMKDIAIQIASSYTDEVEDGNDYI